MNFMRFWKVFYFNDESNPYISQTYHKFFEMLMAFDPEMIDNEHFRVSGFMRFKPTTYQGKKDRLRSFAIQWQERTGSGDFDISYDDLIQWQGFFHYFGKKYGLLREFNENGIC